MDTIQMLETLKQKLSSRDVPMQLNMYENRQTAVIDECAMKKAQLDSLRKELLAANMKINDFRRHMEAAKKTITELTNNMSNASNKIHRLETEILDKSKIAEKLERQNLMMQSENAVIKEQLVNSERECYETKHKLEDLLVQFQTQHEFILAYRNDFHVKDVELRNLVDNLRTEQTDLKEQMDAIKKIGSDVKIGDELVKKLQHCKNEMDTLLTDKEALEKKLIIAEVKVRKFEELLSSHSFMGYDKTHTSFGFLQWQKTLQYYQQQSQIQNATFEKLNEMLQTQENINTTLSLKQLEYESLINDLQSKIKALANKEIKPDKNDVKVEVIEID